MKYKALLFAWMLLPLLAQAGDFEITVDRKKDAVSAPTGGVRMKTSQDWTGVVKIANHGFKPSPGLDARYIIFVKRQKIGQKPGDDQVEKVKGTSKVETIKPGANASFFTSDVTLFQGHMAPGWVPSEGGLTSATDVILGVWVRLYDGTSQVAEYANSPILMTKFKWE